MSLLDRLKNTQGGAASEGPGSGGDQGAAAPAPPAAPAAPEASKPATQANPTSAPTEAGKGLQGGLQKVDKMTLGGVKERLMQKKGTEADKDTDDPYFELKSEIQDMLVNTLDMEFLKTVGDEEEKTRLIKGKIEEIIGSIGADREIARTSPGHKNLVQEVLDEVMGLGPIESLLREAEVSEIMVNGPKQIYVERGGKLVLTESKFRDDQHVMHIIHKIVAPLGRHIDESTPMVDARLKDGSRVNAIIPPLALCGPTLTIRKFAKEKLTVKDLIKFGTLTEEMADFVAACIRVRLNVVVSGGTGSGKTTTLNILSSFIPPDERIITIEDAAELQLRQEHVVSLETRPPNIEGKGEISIRDLVKNCLRMRPERIIVGEIRGGEALDMLQAMNTGHDGSLTTGHANSPRDMISRLETMVMMAGMDLPSKAIREQIASAIDMVVQQNRLRDGSRKITHITEVQGMEGEVVTLTDIFRFEQQGVDEHGKIIGRLKPTGIRPKFMSRFAEEGIVLPSRIFMARDEETW